MKQCVLLTLTVLALGLATARAQSGPDEQYVAIFSQIEQADALADGGQPLQARAEYQAALVDLQKFAGIYPNWSPNIVTFREQYLADKIAATGALISPAPRSAVTTPPTLATSPRVNPPPAAVQVPVPVPVPDARLTQQLADLQAQVQNLQAGNASLELKLREALAAQPAAIEPRALAAAQEQVRSLMKENDLLRVRLAAPGGTSPAARVLVESNALVQAQRSLANESKQLATAMAQASALSVENRALQAQTKTLLASQAGVQALRDENELLKKQLATAKPALTADELQSELTQAQAEIAALKAAARQNDAERAALLARLSALPPAQVLPAATPPTTPTIEAVKPAPPTAPPPADAVNPLAATVAEDAVRIHDLEQERDLLKVQLLAARQLWGGSASRAATNALVAHLNEQLHTLQTRLAVVEAQRVPYTSEELALFRPPAPEPKPVPASGATPSQATALMATANGYFAAHEYTQAAGGYQSLLQHDENNGLALANLAAVELSQGHLPEAEKHIQAALALSPNDAYNLSVLGHLRLQEENYDAALDTLGRAAKLDPQNADIEVWLGITLGHLGLRLPAETALRQALLLAPANAEAHNNLAVIYISEQPPRAELARWHYLKALASGQPHNPGLEKLLAANGAAIPTP